MENIYKFRENSSTASLESASSITSVPKSIIRIMVKFGLRVAIPIAINRLRYRVRLRMRYNLALLRTLQANYNKLDANRLTKWLIRKSITSYRLSNLLWRIEMHFNADCSGTFTKLQNSKRLEKDVYDSQLFNFYHQNL